LIHFLIISKLTNDASVAIAVRAFAARLHPSKVAKRQPRDRRRLVRVELDAGAAQDQSEACDCQGASAMNGEVGQTAELREASDLALINDIAGIALRYMELRPMLQSIVQALKRHLNCEFVDCATLDVHTRSFVCEALESDVATAIHVGYGREFGSGVVGEVAATGRSLLVADTRRLTNYVEILPGARSELCVPVKRGREVIAVINAESTRLDAFGDRQLLLETVAEQVAGAIASARLNQELRRRVELLGMMSNLLRAAVEAVNLDDALERIVVFVQRRFHLELCAVMLVDETQRRLLLKAQAGKSNLNGESVPEWPTRLGINGRAFRTGAAQFVPDVNVDPDYVMGNPDVICEYVVPIRFEDRLLGLIDMESANAESFSEENRVMLDALAAQVAGAIHLTSANQRLSEINREVAEKSAALEKANAQLREANDTLQRLSHSDGLTGIGNRRRFDQGLRSQWRRARRHGHELSLVLIDIDDFKAYNDGYGHLAGDECLKRVAAALNAATKQPGSLLARYGGEEFAVLLPQTGVARALRCAEQLHDAVAALALPHRFARASQCVSASVGVATLTPEMRIKPSTFIRRADRALYVAKAEGRNRVVLASDA
jgi:diguanylate cyclase (GGDEF)-like protein